jgi:glutathione-regulated potassium-efflux system protein KefB
MAENTSGFELYPVLVLLASAVVAGFVFKRLGFGSVLGYLIAGVIVGPCGLRVMTNPAGILHVAELGVVLFLFIVGLEMRPTRLWSLRKQIFGLGVAQFVVCLAPLTVVAIGFDFKVVPAFVVAAGFVMTSTAIVVQTLADRCTLQTGSGQRILSILLLEDLSIVPLFAAVAFLGRLRHAGTAMEINAWSVAASAAGIVAVVLSARYLLNPLFRLIASGGSRDVMSATALLVVLGAAYAFQAGGFSMAMGAFLAGVLLAESSFRNQLEVDVEPFRAMLLGLFFLAVGMSLDMHVVLGAWRLVVGIVLAFMATKAIGVYCVARAFGSSSQEASTRAALMAQGGEFAFVLFGAAQNERLVGEAVVSLASAVVILSMILTPLVGGVLRALPAINGVEARERDEPRDLSANVLIVGFGRVGQIASQLLIAQNCSVSIIDKDFIVIEAARNFDLRVYYGDGTQLDVLRMAGAGRARAVLVCVDDVAGATRIVQLLRSEFPRVCVVARSFDRRHSLDLVRAGAHFQVRETFESALLLGSCALQALGISDERIASTAVQLRGRDTERFKRDLAGGIEAGDALFSRPSTTATDLTR